MIRRGLVLVVQHCNLALQIGIFRLELSDVNGCRVALLLLHLQLGNFSLEIMNEFVLCFAPSERVRERENGRERERHMPVPRAAPGTA